MANVLDLRRRIRSVKNTRQITRAMKLVSAAKLRRAQDRAVSSRPYASMLTSVIQSLVQRIEVLDPHTGEVRHPLLLSRPIKNITLIVVAGDKGFAGAFNGNITKAAARFIQEHDGLQVNIEAIGRKSRDYFRRRYPEAKSENPDSDISDSEVRPPRDRQNPIEVTGDYPGLLDKLSFERAGEISESIVDSYIRNETDAAYLVFNEFKSVISQRLVVEKLLPIVDVGHAEVAQAQAMSLEERQQAAKAAASAGVSLKAPSTKEGEEEASKFGTAEVDYIYEQPPHELLDGLLRQYVTTQIYHALTESVAAEHAARMTAMDSATNNASEIIDSLTLAMNRARQAAITKEIIEIVSGAAAL